MKLVNWLALFFVCTALPVHAANLKVGVVEIGKIIQQSPQREGIVQKLNTEFKDRIDQMKSKEKSIVELQQKLERDKMTMSMKESQEVSRKIEELTLDYRLKGKQLQEDKRRRENEESQKLMISIKQAINAVSKQGKYDLVFKQEALEFSSGKTVNLTDEVIKFLKKK
ncbi:MAG: OmpH family outer membrane protein [Pseudomonadota bacterium]